MMVVRRDSAHAKLLSPRNGQLHPRLASLVAEASIAIDDRRGSLPLHDLDPGSRVHLSIAEQREVSLESPGPVAEHAATVRVHELLGHEFGSIRLHSRGLKKLGGETA
jgi:hypothetical protein